MVRIIYGTNNCWGHGTLQDGQCYCYTGYDGVDCSGTNDTHPPTHTHQHTHISTHTHTHIERTRS